jgi:hypothetical protein
MHLLALASCYNQTKLFVANAHLFYVLILAPVALCELSLSSSMLFVSHLYLALATWSDSNFPPRLVLTRFPTFEIAECIKKDGG